MRTTSSSISSSDARASGTGAWRRFGGTLAVVALALFIALVALCVTVDPYDTGRLAVLQRPGVPEQGPRTANASRGRDPAFRGAIIGNSHLQLVSPAALSEATGIPFVSLTIPATGPKEQLAVAAHFLRHRREPAQALVMAIDDYWCTADPALPPWKPFPFWLYDPSLRAYLAGLIRFDSLERLPQRLGVVLGRRPRARPDGYWDYEQYRSWSEPAVRAEVARPGYSEGNPTGVFPAFEQLAAFLDARPDGLPVVLVRPPVYRTALPEPGSVAERNHAACREAARRVADRSGVALIDARTRGEVSDTLENWFDHTHYRAAVARRLEGEIAAALARLRGR